jgi:glucose-1-phosphate adenylyltransferase
MDQCSVYLVEGGFPEQLPGFSQEIPSASFPFWGSYRLLDFAAMNFAHLNESGYSVIADSRYRSLLPFITSRGWQDREKLVFLDQGLEGFTELVRRDPAETILLCPLSLVCDLNRHVLNSAVENRKAPIAKLSVKKVETDIYLARREALLEALESYGKRHTLSQRLSTALFSQVLHSSFEAIQDIPGKILFLNNLTQLFKENLWLVGQTGRVEVLTRLFSSGKSSSSANGTIIEKEGHVKNSLLAPGARIEGYVEGSFIFPDVVVHRGAAVVNSVVMNGNRIGGKAQLYKTLVLPYLGDLGSSNIGENTSIGMREAGARNFDYPNQIREGVTVLGINAEVPKGYKIGPGCLVGARVSAAQLRSIKELTRSSSVVRAEEAEQE